MTYEKDLLCNSIKLLKGAMIFHQFTRAQNVELILFQLVWEEDKS